MKGTDDTSIRVISGINHFFVVIEPCQQFTSMKNSFLYRPHTTPYFYTRVSCSARSAV